MTAPEPTTTRREWSWLLTAQTAAAVVALLVVYALTPAWVSAIGVALSVWAIAGAAGAWILRHRQDRR